MYNVPDNNYLRTYDPNVTEIHSDSSDFEGTHSSLVTTHTKIRRKFSMKRLFTNRKKDSKFQKCNSQTATENSSKETWGSVTTSISQNGSAIGIQVQKSYKNKKYKILDDGDQIETINSKRSVIRHKVRPCLSSIFGCPSNNVKQMSIIKENPTENVNIDNGCQATCVNREHKIRKFNRRQYQCYAAQPVYAVEGNIHAKSPPFQHTKIVREPLSTCKAVGNGISDNIYSLTSSSEEVETRKFFKRKKGKLNKPKHIAESGIGKDFFERYEGQGFNHIEQQCPSKNCPMSPFQIYTNPYQNQQEHNSTGCSPTAVSLNRSGFEIGTACSGFWEYIVNKLNTKLQPPAQPRIKKSDEATNTPPFKPCSCSTDPADSSYCCCPDACGNAPKWCPPPPKPERKQESPAQCSCYSSATSKPIQCSSSGKIKTPKKKRICKCPSKKHTKSGPGPNKCRPASPRAIVVPRPCQLNHDEITKLLSSKYNGEILCIHNPPCILINGCLNIPPPKLEETMDLYSVTSDVKSNKFGNQYRHPSLEVQQGQNVDAGCQYLPPMKEVKSGINNTKNESCQYQIPFIMRQLRTPNYDIHYESSLVEVQKQLTTDDDSCEHLESSSEIQKHQATAIKSYKYWLATDAIRQQGATSESCQYRSSPTEIQKHSKEKVQPVVDDIKQMKTQQQKQEKIIQSICNHKPPCEVVRTCCKTIFDPKLQNSCVHVPMCENVPLCLMELKNRNQNIPSCKCPHNPKCTEVPICTRNYIVLTAKEEVATQVRPKTKMVCRHEPPCIMIPTCLARVCDNYIPYNSIPDCVHQPMCEMIPACCRKPPKEMVSVRAQYPSQCCIV